MASELTQYCVTCGDTFIHDASDASFLSKMRQQFPWLEHELPAPTRCPLCRLNRRLVFRNLTSVAWAKEYGTAQKIFSFYPGGAPFPIISNERWWAGEADPLRYGRDFDYSRPFFDQF